MSIKTILQSFNKWAIKLNTFKFILVFIGLLYLTDIIFALIITIPLELFGFKEIIWIDFPTPDFKNIYSYILSFISIVLITPFFETLIFKTIPYKISKKIKPSVYRNIIVMLISSVIFALSHCYSFLYILKVFPSGIILIYAYFLRKKSNQSALVPVSIIHSIINFIAFGILSLDIIMK